MSRPVVAICACIVLLAACGGEDPVAPGTLASITLSPSSATLGIGQTQSLTAQGKDQDGNVLSGLSFTWASSDNGIATVAGGVATGVAAGAASITASSGGVTSNPVSLTVGVTGGAGNSIVIDKASVLLPVTGGSAQLTAQILDPQGAPVAGTIRWISSAPDRVSVDPAGQVTAVAIGSAQIFAEGEGLRSAPTLVFVANPKPGALLVTDAQVVSVGPPLGLPPGTAPGVGTEYEVTLNGVAPPATGTVFLAAETAPIAGKVVSTRQGSAGLVVTLALEPLHELFTTWDIALQIDLSAFPAVDQPEGSVRMTPSAAWNAGARDRRAASRALDDLAPFQNFVCDASIKPQLLGTPISLSLENRLTLTLEDNPGYSKHALVGSIALVGNAGLKLKAGFRASGDCKAQAQIRLPVFGWFSVLAMPAVRVGLGAGLEGEILLVQGELGVEGKVGASLVVGWECGGATPACRALDDVSGLNQLKTKSKIPSENDMQAKISAQFYLLAGLDLSLLGGAANAEIVEARLGPEQSFDLAFEKDQAERADYASSYDLKLKGVVEPGGGLKKAIEMVIDDDATGVTFNAEFTSDLSESPKGTLTLNKARVRPGEAVDFTVELTPSTLDYFLLGYNVTGVELYRKREDESEFTEWKAMDQIASNRATYRWVPEEADAGKYEFAAFVNTQLVTPLLEVAPNSIQPVEVSCFSGGASSATSAVRHAASVCADTWVGTASNILKFDGVPQYRTRSTITWTYDPNSSEPGTIVYTASGTFDLFYYDQLECTRTVSPSSFTIEPNALLARLSIIEGEESIYAWGGGQQVSITMIASCPGVPPTESELVVFVGLGSATGPYIAGQARLSGSIDNAFQEIIWDFARP
jgi:hypothetical protein